jgi:hypothetical protein
MLFAAAVPPPPHPGELRYSLSCWARLMPPVIRGVPSQVSLLAARAVVSQPRAGPMHDCMHCPQDIKVVSGDNSHAAELGRQHCLDWLVPSTLQTCACCCIVAVAGMQIWKQDVNVDELMVSSQWVGGYSWCPEKPPAERSPHVHARQHLRWPSSA